MFVSFRRLAAAIFTAVAATLAGCTMCDNPYDYTGPVIDSAFDPLGRRSGSIAGPPAATPEPIPAPPSPPTPPDQNNAKPGNAEPNGNASPPMADIETNSVMGSRLRYAR
jgi:hypothetical protein